ncbi:MAG: alpha/beta fold hydrolase [Chitinophagaceae bacterium]|nr:alpha/beta fold hydrolase [Chitinophagaceae bacterium]
MNTTNYAQQKSSNFLPIVFVHGMLASGDTWTLPFQRFEQQGYSKDLLYVIDWNTVTMGNRSTKALDSVIQLILKKHQVKQVNLVGHSAGGGICYTYLQQIQNAENVAHYVHLGSGKMKTPPTVPTLNLYSLEDKITGGTNIDGVKNIALTNKDHYEVATSQESFEAMFQFFNDATATTIKTSTPKKITVGGRVVTFGENKPEANATITVFAINAIEGKRKNTKSIFTTTTDSMGYWSGFNALANENYEFVVQSADTAKRAVHYFREPFTHNNSLVYLRTLSNKGMTGMIAQQLPANNNQSVLAVFSANKAVINGRDSLTVNGINLSDKKFTTAEKTAIAFFLYDNGDEQSSTNKHAGLGMLPFMNMVDVFLPASSKPIQLYFNGRKMNIPAMSSLEDGIMVAVFD